MSKTITLGFSIVLSQITQNWQYIFSFFNRKPFNYKLQVNASLLREVRQINGY